MTIAPACERVRRLPRWMVERGVSRGERRSARRSFRGTLAARAMRLSSMPCAIRAAVAMLQGAITMPRVRRDPEAGAAARSLLSKCIMRVSVGRGTLPSSCVQTWRAALEMIRSIATGVSLSKTFRSVWAMRMPLAPEIPTTMRGVVTI